MKPKTAPPESALVTALAAGDTAGVHRALQAQLDWDRVGELTALHQVDALCWWMSHQRIEEGNLESSELPSSLRDRWRMAYLHHLLRNEALGNDLAVMQEALATRGITAICLKGPWMAFRAYPDPGTRPVGDIDLCIRDRDYREAVAVLEAAGWQHHGPLPATARAALRHSHYRRQLRFSTRGRRPVELHFRLINVGPPGEEEPWLWQEARDLRLGSTLLRVPAPEAMLLHLLLHANQHGFAVLRTLHDIRWALDCDRQCLDSVMLHRLITRLRCRAACYHALELAVELAGARVDATLLDALRPSALRRRIFAVAWRLGAVRRLQAPRRSMRMEAPLFFLLEMGRARDKMRFLARVLIAAGKARAE